jgi:hypothetical protein
MFAALPMPLPSALHRAFTRRLLTHCLSGLLIWSPALAAQDPRAESQRTAVRQMERFAWLAGEWEGPATVTNSGRTFTLTQRETVRFSAANTVLLVEGRGSMRVAPDQPERTVFAAAGMLTFDAPTSRHLFFSASGSGQAQQFTVETIGADGFIWGYTDGDGYRVRYTITRTAQGAWNEVGERSADGTNWSRTLEMTLVKRPAP